MQGIPTTATNTVTAIALTDSGDVFSFLYNSSEPDITKLYKREFKHYYSSVIVNVKNGMSGLNYIPYGPTGPNGEAAIDATPVVEINTLLLPNTAGGVAIGSSDKPFHTLYTSAGLNMNGLVIDSPTPGNLTVNISSQDYTLINRVSTSLNASETNNDLTAPNGLGEILSFAAANSSFIIAIETSIESALNNYIVSSLDDGATTTLLYGPVPVTTQNNARITSIALRVDGSNPVIVFGGNYAGDIQIYASYDGNPPSWNVLNPDTPSTKKLRTYTSVSIASSVIDILIATHLSSTGVSPGFIYTTDCNIEEPEFTQVNTYGPTATSFTSPTSTNISNGGERLYVVDVTDSQTNIICFKVDLEADPPELIYVTKITFNSIDIVVSRIVTEGFSVLYREGVSNNWNHKVNNYTWAIGEPDVVILLSTETVYTDTTGDGIVDLQFITFINSSVRAILPTYITSQTVSYGIYITTASETNWRLLSNTQQDISIVEATRIIKSIFFSGGQTRLSSIVYDLTNTTTLVYKGYYNPPTSYTVKNGLEGVTYMPLTQTLEIGYPIIPTIGDTYNIGATGAQFNNIYIYGNLYKDGVPFSGGGITAPTDNFMVAGGDTTGLAFSYDGENWNTVPQDIFSECTAVAWNGLIWVAGVISDGGESIVYSSDGINWSLSSQGVLANCLAVAWNGSIWLAGGDAADGGNTIAYSYDGINWTASPQTVISGNDPNGSPAVCRALAWNGLIWVAGASANNKMAYSVDGINWTASESATSEFTEVGQCNCVAWNGTMWVAGGQTDGSTENSAILLYSYDGINWAQVNYDNITNLITYATVAWNGSTWLAGGQGGNIIIQSVDGIIWYTITDPATISVCRSITWNGTIWIACGQTSGGSGILANSTDGLTWTALTYDGFSGNAYAVVSRRILPFVGTGGSVAGLYYRASGPTGPTGGQTGPTGPWLQVSANILPLADNVFDLGATGIQFKDVHFSGNLYQNGTVFSGGGGGGVVGTNGQFTYNNAGTSAGSDKFVYRATGPTGPTGQATGPTGPTIQLGAHLVPTQDLTYDLGATGLRFRDIHVGGSTIYLGDSVSIKATAGGTLTATNAAGTVNLITSDGINGGTLSGSGTTTTVDGSNYYGSHSFSPPFTSIPIVIASIASVSNISSKLAVDTTNLTATGCRIYSDTNGASYNWVATARTEFTFSFYNSVTPVTLVTANSTSLALSVNTSQLLRGGTVPYNNLRLNSTNSSFSPVTININTGIQTITISSLTANTQYTVNITVTDSSSPTPVSLTSSNQSFTTAYPALSAAVIALIAPDSTDRNSNELRFQINTQASGGSGNLSSVWQYKESSVATWPNTPDTFNNGTLTSAEYGTTYNIRLKTTDTTTNLFVYSSTVNATLYNFLSIDNVDVSYPQNAVTSGDIVTISITMASLFVGGVAPYSFNIEGLLDSPLNFALDLTASGLSGNAYSITTNTFAFSSEQTTYLISNNITLVYKWTSSGTSASYPFYLGAVSGDGQTFNNSANPYTFTITGGGGGLTGGTIANSDISASKLKYSRTAASGGSGTYEYTLYWEQVSDPNINGELTEASYLGGLYTIDPLIPDTEYKVWLKTEDTGTQTVVNADGAVSLTNTTEPYPQILIGTTAIDEIVLGFTNTDADVDKNTADTITILAITQGATGTATTSPNYIYKACYSLNNSIVPTFNVDGNEWVISNNNIWTDAGPAGTTLSIENLEQATPYYFTIYVYDQALLDLGVQYVTPVFISSYSPKTTTGFSAPSLTNIAVTAPADSGTFVYSGEITSYGGGNLVTSGTLTCGICYTTNQSGISLLPPTIDDNKTVADSITSNIFTITLAVATGYYKISGFALNDIDTVLTSPEEVIVTPVPPE